MLSFNKVISFYLITGSHFEVMIACLRYQVYIPYSPEVFFLLLFLRIHFLCPVPHDKRLAICLQFYCPSHCPFFSSLKKMGESVFFLLIPSIVILSTLQMLTDKLQINDYFHLLLLQMETCKLFKSV